MDIDDKLDAIFNDELTNKRKATANAAFEDKVLSKIMIEMLGMSTDVVKLLRREVKERTGGEGKLTFNFFYENYPGFPVYLAFKSIGYVHETTIPDLFKATNKILKVYGEEASTSRSDILNFGLVFNFPGVPGTHMVCHNLTDPVYVNAGNGMLMYDEITENMLLIQQLKPFINIVKKDFVI